MGFPIFELYRKLKSTSSISRSTFPRGERLRDLENKTLQTRFNPRSHEENDRSDTGPPVHSPSFNPRSREGNDPAQSLTQLDLQQFQSTFPRGERLVGCVYFGEVYRFQSTFPRGERLLCSSSSVILSMFQSTFPRGERLAISFPMVFLLLFQSTFPRGERRLSPWTWCDNYDVSIHVPARGTTHRTRLHMRCYACFNPRSREGNDIPCSIKPLYHTVFQSTFPRGERRYSSIRLKPCNPSFNPRSREGND